MFDRTQRWMQQWDLIDMTDVTSAAYEETVLA
jgi:hypothetical protein